MVKGRSVMVMGWWVVKAMREQRIDGLYMSSRPFLRLLRRLADQHLTHASQTSSWGARWN